MGKKTLFWLAGAVFVLIFGFTGERAMAQYSGEFIICIDGSSPDACRATAIPPNEDGVVVWGRAEYGRNTLCVGVGFEPQDTDCNFTGSSYIGFDCARAQDTFGARVLAGGDMAIACGPISPLPNGNYSAKPTRNTCFDDPKGAICGNFILVETLE